MSTPTPTSIVSTVANAALDTTRNVVNTTTTAVDNISSGTARGIQEVARGADNLITHTSRGIGNVMSGSGEIVGRVGTNLGKTVYEIGNIPSNICSSNFSINIIILVIFGYYLYTRLSGMIKENVNIYIEGLAMGIVLSVLLSMSMTSFKEN